MQVPASRGRLDLAFVAKSLEHWPSHLCIVQLATVRAAHCEIVSARAKLDRALHGPARLASGAVQPFVVRFAGHGHERQAFAHWEIRAAPSESQQSTLDASKGSFPSASSLRISLTSSASSVRLEF